MKLEQFDVIELNEAFAAQGLAVLRQLGLKDNDPRVNRWGGAIALGHPLGASGARLALTAARQLHQANGRYALCTMCIGVGQGIALILERVRGCALRGTGRLCPRPAGARPSCGWQRRSDGAKARFREQPRFRPLDGTQTTRCDAFRFVRRHAERPQRCRCGLLGEVFLAIITKHAS